MFIEILANITQVSDVAPGPLVSFIYLFLTLLMLYWNYTMKKRYMQDNPPPTLSRWKCHVNKLIYFQIEKEMVVSKQNKLVIKLHNDPLSYYSMDNDI